MPALVTPFTRTGTLDVKAHVRNVRSLAERGIEGFVIAGSNGEGPYLESGERAQLIKVRETPENPSHVWNYGGIDPTGQIVR